MKFLVNFMFASSSKSLYSVCATIHHHWVKGNVMLFSKMFGKFLFRKVKIHLQPVPCKELSGAEDQNKFGPHYRAVVASRPMVV